MKCYGRQQVHGNPAHDFRICEFDYKTPVFYRNNDIEMSDIGSDMLLDDVKGKDSIYVRPGFYE